MKFKKYFYFLFFVFAITNYCFANYQDDFFDAVVDNDYFLVKKLVKKVNVNVADKYGYQAIVYAINNGNYDIVKLLIKHGANLNKQSVYGMPIYCLADRSYNDEIVKLIVRNSNYSSNRCRRKYYSKDNSNINYNYDNSINILDYILNWKVGAVVGTGAAITLALSSNGSGGSGSGDNNKYTKPAFVDDEDYNYVGADVDENRINEIINADYYDNRNLTNNPSILSNADDLNLIRLPCSIARNYTGANTKVAVFDSGVVNNHRELQNVNFGYGNQNVAYLFCSTHPNYTACKGINYIKDDPSPFLNGSNWHGTAVASIIGASIGDNMVGIAPDTEIIPYRLTMNDGSFVPTSYIGDAFKNAMDAGAKVINNSYGMDSDETFNASKIDRDSLNIIFGDNYLNQIMDGVKNRDTIFVFAAGNESQKQSSVNTSLPLLYPEVFYENGNYKGFINVVAFDTNTGSLAHYSNQCGVTKEYCITAPGTNLILADTKDGSYLKSSGTSFSAPIVSGAVAVLQGAFPYLSNAEITKLIFTTARDLGEPGIDEVYGWGMLDLERATRPAGIAVVPISTQVQNSKSFSLQSSTIEVNSLIANSIKKAKLKFAFADSFMRTFSVDLNDYIKSETESINVRDIIKLTGKRYKTKNIFDNNAKLYFDITKLSYTNYMDLNLDFIGNDYAINLYFGNDPYSAFINNKSKIYNNYSLIKSYDYNSLNPYFRNNSEKNFGVNFIFDWNDNLQFNFGGIYQNYSINYSNDYAYSINRKDLGYGVSGIAGLNYKFNDNFNTKIELGIINERDTMLGSKTDGAFSIGNNNTTYFGSLFNNLNFFDDLISIFANGTIAYTKINEVGDSLIKKVSNITSSALSFGINYNLNCFDKFKNHNISFLITQPIKIENGNMNVSLPVGRLGNNFIYEDSRINLKSEKKYDLQLAYNIYNDDLSINAGILFRDYLENENIVFFKFKKNL